MKLFPILLVFTLATGTDVFSNVHRNPWMGPSVKEDCAFNDFDPCECLTYGWQYENLIYCTDVPVSQIQTVFKKSNITQLMGLFLTSKSDDYCNLPDDLIDDKLIGSIYVKCEGRLNFNSAAFRSSINYSTSLGFNADLSQLNFDVLTQFPALTSLSFSGSLPSLQSMPFLPKLESLSVYCHDFRQWHAPELTPALTYVDLSFNSASSDEMHRLLDFFTSYSQTLEWLNLWNVSLGRFPSQIESLKNLKLLDMRDVRIPRLEEGSVAIGSKIQSLILFNSDVETIEPDAFKGDFSECYLGLTGNRLTHFDEQVFRDLLESFTDQTSAVLLSSNPITCDCHLNWLIRDNRNLLTRLRSAACSNGTIFEDLSPQGFEECSSSAPPPPSAADRLVAVSMFSLFHVLFVLYFL